MKTNIIKNTPELHNINDGVLVSIDAEWESHEDQSETSGEDVRSFTDVISLQVAIAKRGCPVREYVLYRDKQDRPFRFIDLHKLVKDFYKENGIEPRKVDNSHHNRFKSKNSKVYAYDYTIIGFWLGVDISIFEDWKTVLDTQTDNLINLKQQALATKSPLSASIKTNSHRKGYVYDYAVLNIRDMMLLSAAKVNLDAIGKMLHYPKLDTEEWDKEDGKPVGFYKTHMRTLLENRPKDYEKYALTDSEICLVYADEWLGFLKTLPLSAKDKENLPFACGSLGAKVAKINGETGSFTLAAMLSKMMQEDPLFVSELQFFVKKEQVDGENVPLCNLAEVEPDPLNLIKILDWNMIRNGYYQAKDICDDPKHRNGVLDNTSKKLFMESQQGFETANQAFFGGHNVSYTHGKISNRKVIDIDAKSAYNVGGHLIPDFITSVGWQRFSTPIDFSSLINDSNVLVNGAFTLGYLEADVDYPDDAWLTLTPYRAKIGDTPVYVKHMKRAMLTLTDAVTAYELGAQVIVYGLCIPMQDKLVAGNGYMNHVCPTGKAQELFAKERAKYPKDNPKNALNKMLGNSVYGKTGQGLHQKIKRAYDDYKMYYLPFSSVTNPFIASQYTAITRYILMRLIGAAMRIEPSLKLESITTDGFLTTVDPSVNTEEFSKKLTRYLETAGNESPLWVYVARNFFNGVFFEIKADTLADLYNIRTRFQITKDGNVHALAGLKDVSVDNVFDDLEHSEVSVQTRQKRFTSLTDEKHLRTLKGLLKVDDLFVTQKYNYDFTRKLIKFIPGNDGHGYFETAPFEDINEYHKYRKYALVLAKNWCITDNSTGNLFLRCMQDLLSGKKDVSYRSKDKTLLSQQDEYKYRHFLRYIVAYQDGEMSRKELYDKYFSKVYDNYGSFARAYQRSKKKLSENFINYLAITELLYKRNGIKSRIN